MINQFSIVKISIIYITIIYTSIFIQSILLDLSIESPLTDMQFLCCLLAASSIFFQGTNYEAFFLLINGERLFHILLGIGGGICVFRFLHDVWMVQFLLLHDRYNCCIRHRHG